MKVCIRPNPLLPDKPQGYVRTDNEAEALMLIDLDHAHLPDATHVAWKRR